MFTHPSPHVEESGSDFPYALSLSDHDDDDDDETIIIPLLYPVCSSIVGRTERCPLTLQLLPVSTQ